MTVSNRCLLSLLILASDSDLRQRVLFHHSSQYSVPLFLKDPSTERMRYVPELEFDSLETHMEGVGVLNMAVGSQAGTWIGKSKLANLLLF